MKHEQKTQTWSACGSHWPLNCKNEIRSIPTFANIIISTVSTKQAEWLAEFEQKQ